ncbi:hypothetical protein NP233_g874 [Leucocoprinus birnbaumii]|uniref:Methyltransferase domain-containing protein n=1 Tax=Leucocoprinus birnbaumii TaxID=56174 RepID=A0AAD5YZZ3_9AGAR|nr:hypothetical protein NP233_g874 [Leucocoprinus birnbaumii]
MSSRAAGGRKRQLKPLYEPQGSSKDKEQGKQKTSKSFFSRNKSKPANPTPAPSDPASNARAASAYPSPPPPAYPSLSPAAPSPLQGHPSGTSNSYPTFQQGDAYGRSLNTVAPRSSTPLAIPQQHRYNGAMSRTPTVQSNFSSSSGSYTSSSSSDGYLASYNAMSRSPSLSPPSTHSSIPSNSPQYRHAQEANEDARYPNFSRPQPQAHQQFRPLPVPGSSPPESVIPMSHDFPYPPASSPPLDSLLLQPMRRDSPLPSEFPGRRPSPLFQGSPRMDSRLRSDSAVTSQSHDLYLRPDLRQSYEPSISDAASSIYPSPPSSNPRHTPLPRRWNDASSAVSDGESGNGYRSFSSASASSSASSGIEEMPRNRPSLAPSIMSNYSESSQQTSSSDPVGDSLQTKSPPSSFHFPGSRSTSRPKVSAKTGTPQKLKIGKSRAKNSEDEESDWQYIPPTPTTDSSVSPGSSSSYDPGDPRSAVGPPDAAVVAARPRTDSTATSGTSATVGSTWSSSSNGSAKTFVYPSSRSRAQPSRAPLIGNKKKNGTDGSGSEGGKKSKFMGIGIRLKRQKRNSKGSLVDSRSSGSSSPRSMFRVSDVARASGAGSSPLPEGGSDGQRRQEYRVNEYGQASPPVSPSPSLSQSPSPAPVRMPEIERKRRGKGKGKGKFGSYPLDPFDSLLLDNDRLTGDLLRRLNPTNSPTFHNYGNMPPSTILDLGCGQGYWVLDAAIAWKGYGTHVTGYDMVDTMKSLRPLAVSHGVADNIGLRQRLPFPDESFDLVRMSCLTFCITSDAWEDILQEVCRVLALGGRLEIIDDHIFFPYGKPPQSGNDSLPSFHSMLGIDATPVASDRASVYSMMTSEAETKNPGLGLALSEDASSLAGDLYDLYGLREEEDEDDEGENGDRKDDDEGDTATLNGFSQDVETSSFRATPRPQGIFQQNQHTLSAVEWNHQHAISKDLEALFEHMMTNKFGVHPTPSSFMLDMLKKVFGHAREMTTMHLTLAPPASTSPGIQSSTTSSFNQCPGLMLWPSTLIAMPPSEIELHTSKHLRTLLSCKNSLVEHALEAADDDEIDEESVLEAIWEYESFLRPRFFPPPGAALDIDEAHTPTPLEADLRRPSHRSNPSSSAASVFSAASVSTENQDAMWEYQLDVRQHFGWPEGQNNSSTRPGSSHTEASGTRSSTPRPAHKRDTIISSTSSAAPPYSLTEPTHVRTFRVFEAIKLDQFTLEATAS